MGASSPVYGPVSYLWLSAVSTNETKYSQKWYFLSFVETVLSHRQKMNPYHLGNLCQVIVSVTIKAVMTDNVGVIHLVEDVIYIWGKYALSLTV